MFRNSRWTNRGVAGALSPDGSIQNDSGGSSESLENLPLSVTTGWSGDTFALHSLDCIKSSVSCTLSLDAFPYKATSRENPEAKLFFTGLSFASS
jgi:hypothetical protein